MAEVIREPGFLWAQRCRLEQRDEQGWLGYLLIYGLESREALERYLASPARERFWRELEPFADSRKACCGFFFAREKGRGAAYHDGVYRARWLEAGDIGQEETLAEVAERAGLAREELLAALRDGRYEAALERSNEDARAEGVFGFPFFIYEGKRFWGNDRIEWLVREIKKT